MSDDSVHLDPDLAGRGSPLHYRPPDGHVGDAIPFFWQGVYHVFYLKRHPGGGTPWAHLVSRDLVHWEELPIALPVGAADDPDGGDCWTGSVVEHRGVFHLFYTGHNDRAPRPQTVCHATSQDLLHWEKDPANPVLLPEERWYETADWRDPYVFWNDQEDRFWMTITTREKTGASPRRGCLALATSTDLAAWTVEPPLWNPWTVFAPECSDLFRIGPLWYLIFSSTETRFRYARKPRGPWLAPQLESLDEAHLYAAKRLFDGQRHLLFGWVPSRTGETDAGAWEWGGHLGIARELVARGGGELSVRPADEVTAVFRQVAIAQPADHFTPASGEWAAAEGAWVGSLETGRALCSAEAPNDYLLTAKVYLEGRAARAGFLLRATDDLQSAYMLVLEPARQRICLKHWTSWSDTTVELDRPVAFSGRRPNAVKVFVQGSVLEVFVDDRVSLATRIYDRPSGKLGLFVDDGLGRFEGLEVRTL